MLKVRTYCLVMALCLLFVSEAQARVCFLSEGDGRSSDIQRCLTNETAGSDSCMGYKVCAHPKQGSPSCSSGDRTFYESCCSGESVESLGQNKECTGEKCTATDGKEYCSASKCKSTFKLCKDNQVGQGISCSDSEGTKYLQCGCSSQFSVCGSNQSNNNSESCYDELAEVTKYRECTCTVSGDDNWTTDSSKCLCGIAENGTCSSLSSGHVIQTYYKCKPNPLPEGCLCGYTYWEGQSGCYKGCNDSEYTYQGVELPAHSNCDVSFEGLKGGMCARGCVCSAGFYDYNTQCTQVTSACTKMGYKETACDGDYVSCPYDATYKKCLGGGSN